MEAEREKSSDDLKKEVKAAENDTDLIQVKPKRQLSPR